MRVRWEKRSEREFVADTGDATLLAWTNSEGREWFAEYFRNTGPHFEACHHGFRSLRAAKREAVRMWKALRRAK